MATTGRTSAVSTVDCPPSSVRGAVTRPVRGCCSRRRRTAFRWRRFGSPRRPGAGRWRPPRAGRGRIRRWSGRERSVERGMDGSPGRRSTRESRMLSKHAGSGRGPTEIGNGAEIHPASSGTTVSSAKAGRMQETSGKEQLDGQPPGPLFGLSSSDECDLGRRPGERRRDPGAVAARVVMAEATCLP